MCPFLALTIIIALFSYGWWWTGILCTIGMIMYYRYQWDSEVDAEQVMAEFEKDLADEEKRRNAKLSPEEREKKEALKEIFPQLGWEWWVRELEVCRLVYLEKNGSIKGSEKVLLELLRDSLK